MILIDPEHCPYPNLTCDECGKRDICGKETAPGEIPNVIALKVKQEHRKSQKNG